MRRDSGSGQAVRLIYNCLGSTLHLSSEPMKRRSIHCGLAFVLLGLGFINAGIAAEPTAFELIKEGNRHVGEEARDQVVQIRSDKSIGTMTPTIWYVVYFDPDAT